MTTTTARLYYKEALFDANRDLMVGYLAGEGTPAEMAREMIGNAWDAWTARLRADHPELTEDKAQRIINEAIGFLYLAGLCARESHGPSREVDLGWHVMLSDTRVYAAVCHVVAGRFIHHDASDLLGEAAPADGGGKCQTCGSECKSGEAGRERRQLRETVAALAKLGPVDAELWPVAGVLEPA
jgi:hypothetical protein